MDGFKIALHLLNLIILIENPTKINAFRVFDVNGVQTYLALENEDVSIECRTDMSMAYCGFIHPSGKRFSFSGNSLIDGRCRVTIQVTKKDSGDWRCHVGKRSIGVEIKQDIKVRVVSQIAAVEPNITAIHGKETTLSCVTTKEKTPLTYCRFEPPNGDPFSIDSNVKSSQPILGKYYYPQNKSLDRGDCAVTVHTVKYTDVGAWTCGAGLGDGVEHTAVIRLQVEGLYTMSTASTTGITFGTIGIFAFLSVLGLIVWKKRRFLGTAEREPEGMEIEELPRAETPGSQRTPEQIRRVPTVVVQSPSVKEGSPSLTQ